MNRAGSRSWCNDPGHRRGVWPSHPLRGMPDQLLSHGRIVFLYGAVARFDNPYGAGSTGGSTRTQDRDDGLASVR